jgi:hypothetical protein
LTTKDASELEAAEPSALREIVAHAIEVSMSDDVQHSTHRSATSAARALLASPEAVTEAAATVAASPAVSRLLAPPGVQTPMAPVSAAGSTAAAPTPANQSARIPPRIPGWEEAESRRAADTATEASWRSHASGSGDGGGLGGDSS